MFLRMRSLFSPAIAATLHLSGEQKEKLKTNIRSEEHGNQEGQRNAYFRGAENVVKPFDDKTYGRVRSPSQLVIFKRCMVEY